MELSDDLEKAADLGQRALKAIGDLEIAATPNNYLIWYSHLSGDYPQLSRTLDVLRSSGDPFDDARNAEIYERFFGSGHEARVIQDTSKRVEAAVGRLTDTIAGVSDGASRYGDALSEFSGRIGSDRNVADITSLVAEIVDETARMKGHASQLETQLITSSQQIANLRQDLQSARREANTDALTGIANRKNFDIELRQAATEAMESDTPLCLCLADIDHFKKFNDNHGHQMGDRVLQLVARTLTKCIKGRDLAARYGGEEFALVLPETMIENAATVAESIRRTVGANRIVLKGSGRDLGAITLSVGVARYRPGEPLRCLLKRADDALYRAKNSGRNRVESEAALSVVEKISA